jgi:hypothetical protein
MPNRLVEPARASKRLKGESPSPTTAPPTPPGCAAPLSAEDNRSRSNAVQAAQEAQADDKNWLMKEGKRVRLKASWGAEAARRLVAMNRAAGLPLPANPSRYCKRWAQHWQQQHSLSDLPRGGRARKISDAQAQELAARVAAVEPRSHRAMKHDARFAAILAELADDHGKPVSSRTVWRAIFKADPELLKCLLIEFRTTLKPEQKLLRMRNAIIWLKIFCKPHVPDDTNTPGLWDGPPLPAGAFPDVPLDGKEELSTTVECITVCTVSMLYGP